MSRPRKADDLIVAALAHGKSQAAAARFAAVSERTVRRRLENPEFVARVDAAQAAVTASAGAQLTGLYSKAIETLDETLDHEDARIRLSAAQTVLKAGPDFRARTELEGRLLALEETARSTQTPATTGH